jgi:small redox-active disulfide protein 2
MKLMVLGTGCAKCNQLYAATEQAAKECGLAYELKKISDLRQIMALGIMSTPALVVNGVVKASGRVPGLEELKGILASVKP